MSGAKSKPKSVSKSRDAEKSRQEKQSTVEVASEIVGAAPSPQDFIEPDPELTPEEAEQARKRYLLRRFWISARLLGPRRR